MARASHAAPAREHASIVRHPLTALDGSIDLLRADYLTHCFAPHWHEALVMAVVEGGVMRTRIGRRTVVVPAGSLAMVLPGEVHTGEATSPDGFSYRAAHLPPAVIDALAVDGCTLEFVPPVVADPAISDAFVRAHAHWSAPGVDPLREGQFLDALAMLATRHRGERRAATSAREPRLIAQVRDYLESHHARVVTLAELATLTGRSAFHVSRVFREHVGLPPYAYLAQVRLHRALALLARGYSATTVAHETGFVDQSHFSRQFKRSMGMAPGHYARECGLSQLSPRGRLPLVPELASA
ncbi:MAG: AraC family transcriptional regulator [Cytophagaceae bacterium]|nr:AraC family transcriptional regulator [Gemmatimonadaceae bacterium]